MTSKRNKKLDPYIYPESRTDFQTYQSSDRSNERTFYNSNNRKNINSNSKKDTYENIGLSYKKNVNRRYEECSSNQRPRSELFSSNADYDYSDESYYNDTNYYQPQNDTRSYIKPVNISKKSSNKSKAPLSYDSNLSGEDNIKNKTHQPLYKRPEFTVKEDKPQRKIDQDQRRNFDNIPRTRHNSHSKDFHDSRLFNPYKSDTDDTGKTNIKSEHPNDNRLNSEKIDKHIHGGIIRLPVNIEMNSPNSDSKTLSSITVSHNNESKSTENKPMVVLRQTYTQYINSNPISLPPQTIGSGAPIKIPGYMSEAPSYIPPGTINLYRTQPPPLTTLPLIQPLRYTPQMIPDEASHYQVTNVTSKFPIVAQSLITITSLEAQLDGFIRSTCDITSTDWWKSVNKIRNELKNLYRIVISKDLDYCNQVGIEQNLWKSVFYSIMELIRTSISNPDKEIVSKNKSDIIGHGIQILLDGEKYFISLYTELSRYHNVDLEAIFTSRRPPPETSSRTRKLVYLSAQKLLLFLGDLTRYSEIINNTCDYSKARIWYMKAQLLVPKNGRPYNQLAVISIYSNRHLDALYYYTRTLAASNPFSTATQSLSFLFEEARRKGDELVRRNQESLKRKRKKETLSVDCRKKGCIEIWIHPEDGTKEKKVTDDDDTDILAIFDNNDDSKQKSESQIKEDFLSMPLIELNKVFTLSFLNSHGKLFAKINMENFPEVCSTMLQELLGLISHQPCPLTNYRLCHMLIINMYILDRVSQHTTVSTNGEVRTLHQEHASRMTLDFFALLCHRAIEIFNDWRDTDCKVVGEALQLPPDISILLAPICLWTDWMVTHPEYWNPLPSHRDPLLLPIIDDFSLIANLCTKINRLVEKGLPGLSRPHYRAITDSKESEKSINNPKSFVLLEDSLISGFLPMLDQIPKIYLLEDDKWTKEQCEDWIHLEKLSLFGDFLCGITPPFLDYDVDSCTYVSVNAKEGSERKQDDVNNVTVALVDDDDINKLEEDLDLKLQLEIDEINTTHGTLTDDKLSSWADLTEQAEEEEREHQRRIAALKIKRANLKFKEQRNRRFELWRKSLLDHEVAQRFVELEIRPLFLVLDTNCYIDSLSDIDRLICNRRFIVVVPLIVVNELENLSRTNQLKDDVDINHRARQALLYLENKFEKCDQNVKAITSRGTFMYTIAFRAETLNLVQGETNDDIILNCCQYLCKDKASEFMPREKDKPITLHREVVLLTGDRNLRLKALSRHIPVKPLNLFMDWANIRKLAR